MLNYLNRLKIRTELILLIIIVILGLVFNAAISYWMLQKLKIKGPYYEKIIQVQDFLTDVAPAGLDISDAYILALEQFYASTKGDMHLMEGLINDSRTFLEKVRRVSEFWIRVIPEGALDQILNDISRQTEDFFNIWEKQFLPVIRNKNEDMARALLRGELKDAYKAERRSVEKAVTLAREKQVNVEREVDEVYRSSQMINLISRVITIILSIVLAYLVIRSITQRLQQALKQISTVSSEINSHMDQQAQTVTQQSGFVHKTTAAMDELNTSFQHTKSLAQDSSNRAKNALKVSEEGNNLTKQMVEEMAGHKEKVLSILDKILHLSEVIKQIHNVVSTINNLTNQTNILALNAAVQAAHVKQSSEGFSVIASEIRKLADESKKFVAHIDLLAENIKNATDVTVHIAKEGSETVQDSIKLAQSSSKAFDTIISITNNSFEGAEQVSLNIEQQSQAVHQVLEAMEVLNESAHQNLVGLQQVKEELEKLNELSEELKAII